MKKGKGLIMCEIEYMYYLNMCVVFYYLSYIIYHQKI